MGLLLKGFFDGSTINIGSIGASQIHHLKTISIFYDFSMKS